MVGLLSPSLPPELQPLVLGVLYQLSTEDKFRSMFLYTGRRGPGAGSQQIGAWAILYTAANIMLKGVLGALLPAYG